MNTILKFNRVNVGPTSMNLDMNIISYIIHYFIHTSHSNKSRNHQIVKITQLSHRYTLCRLKSHPKTPQKLRHEADHGSFWTGCFDEKQTKWDHLSEHQVDKLDS